MVNAPRGLKDVGNEEFLAAYNDSTLTNRGVVEKLNCGDWRLVSVRLRSERNQARLTMMRTGGMAGEHLPIPADELTEEARTWLAEQAGASSGAPEGNAAEEERSPAAAGAAGPTTDGPAEAPAGPEAGTAEPIGEFMFLVAMNGQRFRFRGPTIKEAFAALTEKLRIDNYSKFQLTDAASGRAVGMGEITNGGSYNVSKQLTAALRRGSSLGR